jgi:hypothetical protein
LLRYATGDRVRSLPSPCPCGSAWPRVEVLGRLGARFSLFEAEFSVDELRSYLYGDDTPLQVALDDASEGRVRMTLFLPPGGRGQWPAMRARLRSHPLLGYLLAAGLVRVRFRPQDHAAERKPAPLLDNRGTKGSNRAG